MKGKVFKKVLIIFYIIILTFLIGLKSCHDFFSDDFGISIDGAVFESIGVSMTEGAVPYRDTFDHKGPLLYFINFIGVSISQNFGVWILELIAILVSIIFIYKIAKKYVSTGPALVITTLACSFLYEFFGLGNFAEEFALPFQLISLDIFLDFFKTPEKYLKKFSFPVLICGLCCAAVFLLRPNMIALWTVFCIAILVYCIKNKKANYIINFIIAFLVGFSILVAPTIIYLISNGAWNDFIFAYFTFNTKYVANYAGDGGSIVQKVQSFVYFLTIPLFFLSFIVSLLTVIYERNNKNSRVLNVANLAFIVVSVILVGMSGQTYEHYAQTLIPCLIYPLCTLYNSFKITDLKKANFNQLVIPALSLIFIIPFFTDSVYNGALDVLKPSHSRNDYARLLDFIENNTTEDEKISILGNDNFLYIWSNRDSSSKYTYQYPIASIDHNILEEYKTELKESNTPLIIIPGGKIVFLDIRAEMNKFFEENGYTEITLPRTDDKYSPYDIVYVSPNKYPDLVITK